MRFVGLDRESDQTWADLLRRLTDRHDLSIEQTSWAIRETVLGLAPPAQLAAFLAALRTKGETSDELLGVVQALVESAVHVQTPPGCVDIAGTGGDGTRAINVSTLAGIVAAGAGVRVVKHGGRAASSTTAGSADLVEALGIPLSRSAEEASFLAHRHMFSYLFAPGFNSGMHHAVDARRALGVPSVFNLVAPLINPAMPEHQVVGVADGSKAPLIADVLRRLGRTGLVVHGRDGLDKLTTTTTSDVWIVDRHGCTQIELDPHSLGIPPAYIEDLRGGDAAQNARLAWALLDGAEGPLRDVVTLNAAAVIACSDLSESLPDRLLGALAQAERSIDSGAALATLLDLRHTEPFDAGEGPSTVDPGTC